MENERIKNVIKSLTLDEKLSLCGLSLSLVSEQIAKKRIFSVDLGAKEFYSPPTFFAAGCTFDTEIMYHAGKSAAGFASENGIAVNGVINLGVIRNPMTDGAETMLSEDPIAVKRLADAFINGAGGRVFARGYAGGESGFENRFYDARAMREIYLLPLERLGKKLGGVFLPYGAFNGSLCVESKNFINGIKEFLRPDVPIIAPAGSVRDAVTSADAGAAVTVGSSESAKARIKSAVENGTLHESKLDAALVRLISFTAEYYESKKSENVSRVKTYDSEKSLAEKSIVLLKNNGVLPLDKRAKLSVCGENGRAECLARFFDISAGKCTEKGKTNIIAAVFENGEFDARSQKLFLSGGADENDIAIIFAPHPVEIGGFSNAGAVIFVPQEFPQTLGALKDILCGELNPCGKLPVTWAEKKSLYPSELSLRAKERGAFCYESVFTGYRYFSSFAKKAQFPFGHGLCYSRFKISKPKISQTEKEISIDFIVENVSVVSGETVVFAFTGLDDKNVFGVKKRLAGFTKVRLAAGESAPAHISVDPRDLEIFDREKSEFVTKIGKYAVFIGFSAEDAECKAELKIKSGVKECGEISPKEIPSYYAEQKFAPSGTETERVMNMPLIAKKPDYNDYIVSADVSEKAVRAAAKKLKKAVGKDVCAFDLSRVPQKVLQNISDCD